MQTQATKNHSHPGLYSPNPSFSWDQTGPETHSQPHPWFTFSPSPLLPLVCSPCLPHQGHWVRVLETLLGKPRVVRAGNPCSSVFLSIKQDSRGKAGHSLEGKSLTMMTMVVITCAGSCILQTPDSDVVSFGIHHSFLFSSILHMKKLRPREVKQLTQGHTALGT